MKKSTFYDPLYDFVVFEDLQAPNSKAVHYFDPGFSDSISTSEENKRIIPFLNTYEINRLNFLRQSGFAFLEYPSSTHTRFAHSIGCCYLGMLACAQIKIVDSDKQTKVHLSKWLKDRGWLEEFLLSLLLHDIGHFPFSHTIESNSEFWEGFGQIITHEQIACGLIQGQKQNGIDFFECYKNFIVEKYKLSSDTEFHSKFIRDLINENSEIDKGVLSYLIEGNDDYIKDKTSDSRIELEIVHELVSGLLDLDRIDHYRRDSYFTGLKYGSNLNFNGLLSGLSIHYWKKENKGDFEIRLNKDSIGHALTLLHSKERLVSDCFENLNNISFNAMFHRAFNQFVGVDEFNSGTLDELHKSIALDLFFLTDDEILNKFLLEGNEEVRYLVSRIQNRKPYNFVMKTRVDLNKYSAKEIRNKLVRKGDLLPSDILVYHSKIFKKSMKPSSDWMNLRYLHDENGTMLENIDDYRNQIKYFKSIQDISYTTVWIFSKNVENIKLIKDKTNEVFAQHE